jgi:hypothetical protein
MKASLKVLAVLLMIVLTSCSSDDDEKVDNRFESKNKGNIDMETLLDKETNLEWVNGVGGCFGGIVNPGTQCDESTFANHDDWRVPTPEEMSTLIKEIDKRDMNLNYINPSCGFMSTSMPKWVLTENSNNPGEMTEMEPANAGLRCVRNNQ